MHLKNFHMDEMVKNKGRMFMLQKAWNLKTCCEYLIYIYMHIHLSKKLFIDMLLISV